ncbi:MAG: tRNA (N(6)-L-threonylcarbamoyladenosine(37)-C(2))-methylthiotransferase MtaB [Clostridiales bacterium]|nr:tRNA (N(6)-L-threonylcarbamoyladenosine(37)-C(2))-methylthiotransferase MtaB [Clostridiales bacterium]
MSKTVAAHTLGCKTNSYDTSAMLRLFKERGYSEVDFDDRADVYIINTCTVTSSGDKKSRQMIRRARAKNPNAVIVAAGCYAQIAPDEVSAISGVNVTLGVNDKNSVVDAVENYKNGSVTRVVSDVWSKTPAYERLCAASFGERTRAFLKVEDGCSQFCAYCAVPRARGPARSRPLKDALAEAKDMVRNGFNEIVITGIHLASYGKDLTDEDLISLLRGIHDIDGVKRVRLGSLEPTSADDRFVRALEKMPKICRHFHLSLQSGCADTLKRMNRRYTPNQFENAVTRLKRAFPNAAVTADVIVGFPGETDEHFRQSLAFVERLKISRLHVFPFSARKGTPAAVMPDQQPDYVKKERHIRMTELGKALRREYVETTLLGEKTKVLFEKNIRGLWEGYTENYVRVVAPGENLNNRMANVFITGTDGDTAFGVISYS